MRKELLSNIVGFLARNVEKSVESMDGARSFADEASLTPGERMCVRFAFANPACLRAMQRALKAHSAGGNGPRIVNGRRPGASWLGSTPAGRLRLLLRPSPRSTLNGTPPIKTRPRPPAFD